MKTDTVKLIYFSPTHTTRKVLEAIAEGIEPERITHIDLTPVSAETDAPSADACDLVIMGVPVYTGRVAQSAVTRIERLKASRKTPAVLVAVYGNRAYEDALIELKDLAQAAGFTPVAAGAFIGEHSFAKDTTPIACGRPDGKDLGEANSFGTRIRNKLEAAPALDEIPPLLVPGNFPYRERTALPKGSPMTREDLCTLCGTCAGACPAGVISVTDNGVTTDASGCIFCCACVKECPTKARVMAIPMINEIADKLSKACAERKAPEFFL